MQNLLIYIPTFNRPTHLRKQLKALLPQVTMNTKRVRVFVADNCTENPEISEIIGEFKGYPGFEFLVRTSNIEANANILFGFTVARIDEFLWILADDTLVSPKAISLVLETIDNHSPDLVALYVDTQESLPPTLNWSIETFEAIFSNYQWGLISSAIYNMGYFSNSIKHAFALHNSSFPHLGVLFSEFKERGDLRVSWLPEAQVHRGNQVELQTDYSLALCGLPHLFLFFEGAHRSLLMKRWVKKHGVAFCYSSSRHEVSSLATREMIRRSDLSVRLSFALCQMEYRFRLSRLGRKMELWIARDPNLQNWIVARYQRIPFRIYSESR
jgi:glycosyltransferase involved in cell wall biosynthesis